MEPNYSKRELDDHFDNIRERFVGAIESIDGKVATVDSKVDKVIEQTTKHNGRMSKMEKWMWTLAGGGTVIVALVIPMLTYYISTVDNRISKLEDIFTSYNITIE